MAHLNSFEDAFEALTDLNVFVDFILVQKISDKTLNNLYYENEQTTEEENFKFQGFLVPNIASINDGIHAMDERETYRLRVQSNKYPFTQNIEKGDIIKRISDDKEFRVTGKRDTHDYSHTIRFELIDNI